MRACAEGIPVSTIRFTFSIRMLVRRLQEVEMVQFMGKDNVPFHTVIFPATLLGTGKPWTMMRNISVTEYLNYEGGKFSKSRGTGVFGNDAKDTGMPVEVWRYYLLSNRQVLPPGTTADRLECMSVTRATASGRPCFVQAGCCVQAKDGSTRLPSVNIDLSAALWLWLEAAREVASTLAKLIALPTCNASDCQTGLSSYPTNRPPARLASHSAYPSLVTPCIVTLVHSVVPFIAWHLWRRPPSANPCCRRPEQLYTYGTAPHLTIFTRCRPFC